MNHDENATSGDFQEIREQIEGIDRAIMTNLRDRMAIVERIAVAKLDKAVPFRDQPREEQVLQRVRHTAVELGLDAHAVERLYRDIMEMSIARQQAYLSARETAPLRVAYQGVEGAYTHLTAQRRYAHRKGGALLSGFGTFHEAVAAVKEGSADIALLPIENTTAGSINETYDLLADGGITINAEVVSHIQHCLLGLHGARIEKLKKVSSHPQALRQCADFLRNLPWIEVQPEFDTAGAARKVKESGDPTLGAIASESAAHLFGLEILQDNIQSQEGNYTRFVEVAREAEPCPPGLAYKTSLMLTLNHEPGALGKLLIEFSRRQVNLTKLESRPIPGSAWKYRFYLDIEGHSDAESVVEAFGAIQPFVSEVRVLGTYPEAEAAGQLRSSPESEPPSMASETKTGEGRPKKLRLDQFLKHEGLVGTGGEAKMRIQGGEVMINGEVVTQRGKGLRPGDVVEIDQETRMVGPELWDNAPKGEANGD